MSIYFDNSATTRVDDSVVRAINEYYDKYYANPAAMHKFGFKIEEDIKAASEYIGNLIGASSDEIIWTSGGSESNNLAISGYIDSYKRRGNHIITTSIEHASVKNVFEKYKKLGFDVTYLDVDSNGHIDLDYLKECIRKDTIFVSIMYVNNEIGSVQNVKEIGKIIKEKNSDIAFHVDFVQGFAKYKVNVKNLKIDLLSVSSHKFNGPKGVGFLYKNKNIRLTPQILGGGQQNGLRSGTMNAPGIIGTMVAAKLSYDTLSLSFERYLEIKKYLIDGLNKLNEKYGIIKINSKLDDTFAPHIVSVGFKGIRAEVMLHAMESYDIYVSAGSACSSHDKRKSNTLTAIGLADDYIGSTIRISLGRYNTIDEAKLFIEDLDMTIDKLLINK